MRRIYLSVNDGERHGERDGEIVTKPVRKLVAMVTEGRSWAKVEQGNAPLYTQSRLFGCTIDCTTLCEWVRDENIPPPPRWPPPLRYVRKEFCTEATVLTPKFRLCALSRREMDFVWLNSIPSLKYGAWCGLWVLLVIATYRIYCIR
jgi:hypothetical protein